MIAVLLKQHLRWCEMSSVHRVVQLANLHLCQNRISKVFNVLLGTYLEFMQNFLFPFSIQKTPDMSPMD